MNDFETIRNKPVIICGHPKSGTTLILNLLDNHPQLTVLPEELKFFWHVYKKDNPGEMILTQTGFNTFRFDKIVYPSGERDYSDINFSYIEKSIRVLCKQTNNYKDILTGCISVWHAVQPNKKAEKVRWVEKTPGNEKYLHTYNKWFSGEVIFLHMIRDPRDNFATYKIKHPNLTLAQFSLNWAFSTEIALYAREKFPHFHIIKYEDLVNNSKQTLKSICKLLEIKHSDSLFSPTKNGKPWCGNSMYGTKFNAISTKSVGKYKYQLGKKEIGFLEKNLAKYLRALDYKSESKMNILNRLKLHTNISLKARIKFEKWYYTNRCSLL